MLPKATRILPQATNHKKAARAEHPVRPELIQRLFDPISERPLSFSLRDNDVVVPLLWPGSRRASLGGCRAAPYEKRRPAGDVCSYGCGGRI